MVQSSRFALLRVAGGFESLAKSKMTVAGGFASLAKSPATVILWFAPLAKSAATVADEFASLSTPAATPRKPLRIPYEVCGDRRPGSFHPVQGLRRRSPGESAPLAKSAATVARELASLATPRATVAATFSIPPKVPGDRSNRIPRPFRLMPASPVRLLMPLLPSFPNTPR